MSDFSINEMQEMQKAGKMRTEKQKTGIYGILTGGRK